VLGFDDWAIQASVVFPVYPETRKLEMEKVMLKTHAIEYIFLPTAEYLSSNASNHVLKLDEQDRGTTRGQVWTAGPTSRQNLLAHRRRFPRSLAPDSLNPGKSGSIRSSA
jgi:hypothetical protein